MLVFIHDSDLHYGKRGAKPRENKEDHPSTIAASKAQFVIVTGDLTDNGYDGASCGCINYGGKSDQITPLLENYVHPLEEAGKEVYLCVGNHDRGKKTLGIFRHSPIKHIIRKRHNSVKYTFRKGDLLFICCGECPSDIPWLKRKLKNLDQPTIIFFHFNLEGPYSDWWSKKQKDAFYNAIKDYNILAILVGHHHITKVTTWRGIRVIASSNRYSVITYNPFSGLIESIKSKH